MTSLIRIAHLLTGVASLAALLALLWRRHDRAALEVLYGAATGFFLATLFWPEQWDPEHFCTSEITLAFLAVFVGLAASRRAKRWCFDYGPAMFSALCNVCSCGVVGAMALWFVPAVPSYRGLAFVDLAVVAALTTIAKRFRLSDQLDEWACWSLSLCFGASVCGFVLFEYSQPLGRALERTGTLLWIVAALGTARIAFSSHGSPKP